jgi:hypothetical protein
MTKFLRTEGGTVFLERRRMQNAADAAALAGTRLLAEAICGGTDATDGLIAEQVNHYAEINGVPSGNVVAYYVDFDEEMLWPPVGNDTNTIPDGSTGISVTVEISRSTHFVTLVGIDTAGALADALAMTGPPLLAGGMRPFGIPLQVMVNVSEGDCFTISFGNCDNPDQCTIEWTGGNTQHRGWMNLAYVWNHGEEDADFPRAITSNPHGQLQDWMQNGWQGVLYTDGPWDEGYRNGDYIHAKPGTEQDVINVAPIDESIYVPIYDEFPDCDGEEPDIEWPWPTSPQDACTGMQGAGYYHIVGFAGVRIASTSTPDHSITMCLEETIMGQGQPSPNEGYQSGGGSEACDTHTMVVTLWR